MRRRRRQARATRRHAGRRARGRFAAEPEDGGLRTLRTAGRHDRGDPGRYGHRGQRGRRRRDPGMPPDPMPPGRPGRVGRLRETRRAERTGPMRHDYPPCPSGRSVIGAGCYHRGPELDRESDRRKLVIRTRAAGGRRAGGRGDGSGFQEAQALVPRHRVQPRPEPAGIGEPVQPGGRHDERVEQGLGGLGPGEHRVAVGVQGRGVPVVRLGDPVRVTCDDRLDHRMVQHAPNRNSARAGARRLRHDQK
jgi:hypothetical protein